MKTFERAHEIFSEAPREAVHDALGLAGLALVIFAGFMAPVLF